MTLRWTYEGGDPSLIFFTELIKFAAGGIPLHPTTPRVLNVGSLEEDWCDRVRQQNPDVDVIGIDYRTDGKDAMNRELFAADSFDLIVGLGSIEHIGLGYYSDPVNPDGDSYTMMNVAHWLRAGGYCTIDVPWTPEKYFISPNGHWRCYTDYELRQRLVRPFAARLMDRYGVFMAPTAPEIARFYAQAQAPYTIYERPPTEHEYPFTYCALLLHNPI